MLGLGLGFVGEGVRCWVMVGGVWFCCIWCDVWKLCGGVVVWGVLWGGGVVFGRGAGCVG